MCIRDRIAISQFRFQKIKFLYIVYNFGEIRSSNPRVYAVDNNTFCGNMAKIGILRKISQWTYLDLLYRFGRCTGGDDYSDIHGNQLNLGDVRHHLERPLLFALAFDKGLTDCEATFKRLNGTNPTISCRNLVNFYPIISEFALLKRTIFAAIRPQFDD